MTRQLRSPPESEVMATPTHRRPRPINVAAHRAAMLPAGLLLVLLLATAWRAEAQASSTPSGDSADGSYNIKISPAVAALLIAFICGFFFLGFFSVYLRRCAGESSAVAGRGGAGINGEGFSLGRRRRGLDRAVLETFPTMRYAKAKELRPEKEAMECAVCLSEFTDEDVLRLLPVCSHVFHVDCVDIWLESHVTCPVCRANLSDPTEPAAGNGGQEATSGNDNTEEEGDQGTDLEAGPTVPAVRRWHSTGHEAAPGAPEDRYTLRLPEHVRREILEAGRLRRAASLTVPSAGEASGRRGYRGGVGAGRSGRWGFLLRTFSVRRRSEVAPAPAPARSASSKRIFPFDGAPSGIIDGGGGVEGKSESNKKMDEGKPSSSTSDPAEDRV